MSITLTPERIAELAALGVVIPPTEDELPYDDGMPMESQRHVLQMDLLIETLSMHWEDRPKGFVGGNIAVYFSLEQAKNQDFRAPDFFAVIDAVRRERKSWVLWQEGHGPDVVVELLSESTAAVDRGEKKRVYQDDLRVPEYFWYDPFSGELAGFTLRERRYRPIQPDELGRMPSAVLDLVLLRWEGAYRGIEAPWLRWATREGLLLPTGAEKAVQAEEKAHQAEEKAHQAEEKALQAQQLALDEAELRRQAEQRAAEAEQRARELEQELQRLRGQAGSGTG
jgi:Uma2 family endonuclease